MRYSLVNRFRGALLGGLLGETLAQMHQANQQIHSDLAQAVVPGATSLIKLGKLDIDNWLELYPHKFTDLKPKTVIFASIPISLFFHDNPVKLHQNLLRLSKWHDNLVVRDSILAIGYAIAQSLTEKLQPQTLIPQIITFIGETPTSIPQNLIKLHNLLAASAGLERVQAELDREDKLILSVSLAFYYFLSTLEDFRLAVSRANPEHGSWRQKPRILHSPTISAITGVLSGTYNSSVSIPVNWRVALVSADATTDELSQISPMLELADALAAVWSGVYDPALNALESQAEECVMSDGQASPCVYAAPRVIRAR
ncbi:MULTISPECIES: hypothetical protein [unclassified Anabaena]|uniref:hypothetical protein n=1 Tax=unclassified Anabaena TaxID=2619674 RepID=UPI000833FCAB|nr:MULTISPECIES: hypothetical protein [unclassified Anabaena]